MKSLSKKSSLGLLLVILLTGGLIFLAYEKEVIFPQSNAIGSPEFGAMLASDVYEDPALQPNQRPAPFNVDILISKCKTTQPSVTLRVVIKDSNEKENVLPGGYSYLWEVNGAIAGKGPVLACFCARSATVTVTRISDFQRVRKTVRLRVCDAKEDLPNYEEF